MQFNTQEQHFKETFEQKIQQQTIHFKELTAIEMNQDESLQKRNPNEDESFAEEKSR